MRPASVFFFFFFFNDTATTEIYTLSLHDALPIFLPKILRTNVFREGVLAPRETRPLREALERAVVEELLRARASKRSEEHTSELQSPCNLVCRLLLEKKKQNTHSTSNTDLSKNTR